MDDGLDAYERADQALERLRERYGERPVLLAGGRDPHDGPRLDDDAGRVAHRLAFVSEPPGARGGHRREAAVEAEADELAALYPPDEWAEVGRLLARHGRLTCVPRAPRCGECVLEGLCPKIDVERVAPGVHLALPDRRAPTRA